jgi:dihydrofolate synthase/folylpolyglutamate synthase
VDGAEISDEALESSMLRWWPRFEEERPSFFEAATAIGFDHFAEERIDFGVVEVGLGGRLDSTNILSPRVCVITTISSDHAEILGGTLARIAREKAGIIKEGGTLILGVRRQEPRAEILRAAAEKGARVWRLGAEARYAARSVTAEGTTFRLSTPSFQGTLRTPLLGAHQARNAALAALSAEAILGGESVPAQAIADAIASGIESTRWPARAELLDGDPPVLLDVAHNVEGARAIAGTASALFGSRPVAVVAAFSRDKDHASILRALGRVAARFMLTQFSGERGCTAERLAASAPAGHVDVDVIPAPAEALDRARAWAKARGGAVLVTGSFFLVGEALPLLRRDVPRAL